MDEIRLTEDQTAYRRRQAAFWRHQHEALMAEIGRLRLDGYVLPSLQRNADRCAARAAEWELEPATLAEAVA